MLPLSIDFFLRNSGDDSSHNKNHRYKKTDKSCKDDNYWGFFLHVPASYHLNIFLTSANTEQ